MAFPTLALPFLRRAPWLTCLGLALVLAWAPVSAQAQQTGARPYRAQAGGYLIGVYSNASTLSLGTVDYVITLDEPDSMTPIRDARVLIHAQHAEHDDRGQAIALDTPGRPGRYTARVELDRPGVWNMSVEVSGPRGRVEIGTASHTIPKPRQSTAGGLVFVGVFTVLMLGVLYLVWSARRAQKQRQLTDAG